MCYRPFVQGRCGSGSSLFCVGASPRCWGSIREQENGLFLTTEMGQQGQFFENLPCWIFLLALPNPFLRFWEATAPLTFPPRSEHTYIWLILSCGASGQLAPEFSFLEEGDRHVRFCLTLRAAVHGMHRSVRFFAGRSFV